MLTLENEKVACFVLSCFVDFILGCIIFENSRNAPASLQSGFVHGSCSWGSQVQNRAVCSRGELHH